MANNGTCPLCGAPYSPPPCDRDSLIARGALHLTPRGFDVFSRLARGMTQQQVAADLGLAETTVKGHVCQVLCDLGAANTTAACVMLERAGLIRG